MSATHRDLTGMYEANMLLGNRPLHSISCQPFSAPPLAGNALFCHSPSICRLQPGFWAASFVPLTSMSRVFSSQFLWGATLQVSIPSELPHCEQVFRRSNMKNFPHGCFPPTLLGNSVCEHFAQSVGLLCESMSVAKTVLVVRRTRFGFSASHLDGV
ncbi:unnamed protein product [Polarella glacialis]|uniref:Uncharacterized protein n=1 Tax=Polarella glacialis TaxID=89957 RepID=A0A813LLX6_POLGL|nr:unnamed protein product [Polarella glacialis]